MTDELAQRVKLVGYGVDTLVLNVRYADEHFQPVQKELDETLAQELEMLQWSARTSEVAVASSWAFHGVLLFVEPHGAGRQWRWLLTSRLLTVAISRGTFNDLIAQVRFSSEYLWSQRWTGDALYHVHSFLMSIFGEHIHLQVSEVHLCADLVGFDFSQVDYERAFVSRVRKNDSIYSPGVDGVMLDYRRVSTLRFSSHGSPLSCTIYNKTLEIKQKSGKTWFYDLWRTHGWDGERDVWRVEFRLKRAFLHALSTPIESPYDLLNQFKPLWDYAAGRVAAGADGLPDGWLRFVVPSDDSNRSALARAHPAWVVVQAAFSHDAEPDLGPVVRQRIREKNLERGVAATIGYLSTLAAWLGGEDVTSDTDVSLVLHWLHEAGTEYLDAKERDFLNEIRKKQERYGSTGTEVAP